MDGFRVDLAALDQASRGINDTLSQLARHRVDTLDDQSSAVGHDRLAAALSEFCQRWQRGVASLAGDARGLAGELSACAAHYRQVDQSVQDQIYELAPPPGSTDTAGQ